MNGLDVTATLRKSRSSYANTPIIMLTARGEESDKLVGLELGADDYIVKPFSAKELVARVRAVLRRSELLPNDYQRAIVLDDIVIDPQKFRVVRKDQPIDVTYTEFQLLSTLAQQPGRIFTRAQLLDAIRGVELESYERIIDSHIKNLRRKLEPDPREPRYILSVYGVGYKFAEPISS
jgi:DNA-binding response OmpR family regulator